jgi:hypothetical protein
MATGQTRCHLPGEISNLATRTARRARRLSTSSILLGFRQAHNEKFVRGRLHVYDSVYDFMNDLKKNGFGL